MSDFYLHKMMLSENELDIIQISLDLTIQSFEKMLDERGHNNMSINDQFTYIEARNLHNKLKDKYF